MEMVLLLGLADGGMASKRGLVDGPGGYAGVSTNKGFGDSIHFKKWKVCKRLRT